MAIRFAYWKCEVHQTTGGALKLKVLKLFDFRYSIESMTNPSIKTKLKLNSISFVKLLSVLFNTKQRVHSDSNWWKWISVSVQALCSSKIWCVKLIILGSTIKRIRKKLYNFFTGLKYKIKLFYWYN